MQLHACLLLFIITTDKTLASLNHLCGGNVSLDHQPTGLINLTLPEFMDIKDNPINQHCDNTLQPSVCTWLLEVPLGKKILLKFLWLEIGSSVSLRCAWNEEDQAIRSGDTALLSSCDRNKASLRWTGPGCSSNAVQLVYRVQEDERNSSEVHSTHQPDQDPTSWSQTGTTFTSPTTVAQEELRGTEEGRGLAWSIGPEPVTGTSSQDERLLRPTSFQQQGHPVAGRTDRETLFLPEEKPNNGADASGATHLVDDASTARTRPYFQHGFSTDAKSKTENPTDLNSPKTAMSWTQSTVGRSTAPLGTDIRRPPPIQTSRYTDKRITAQTNLSVSSSTVILVTSPPPETLAWETDTILTVHDGAVSWTPEDTPDYSSWRSEEKSTDSNLTSATTSELSKSSIKPPYYDSSGLNTDTEPTPSSSASQDPSRTHSPATHITDLDTATTAAALVHPNTSQNGSLVSDASNATAQTAEFESSESEDTDVLHALSPSMESKMDSPESTERLTHPSNASSQTSNQEKQTATESLQRKGSNSSTSANGIFSTSNITKDDQQTSAFTGYFSTPRVLQTITVQHSAAADIARETYTSPTSHTLLHDNPPTDSAPTLSSSTTIDSSAPSYMLQTHTASPNNPPAYITSSPTESSMHITFVNHNITPVPSHPTSLPHTYQDLLLPTSTNISPTYEPSQELITTKYASEHPTVNLDYGKVKVEKGDELRQWSFTAQYWSTLQPIQPSSFPLAPDGVTPITNPVFYIVPNQPAAIRVKSVELLLQIVVEESRSTLTAGLEEDTTAWVEPYLQRAPGFSKLLGVWSSGHAVQSLVEFKTSGALLWLSMSGPTSLLERTGLAQAVREGKMFRSSKITNITLGGLQGDVCDWLLQCPAGYRCVLQPGSSNYSCSSVCRFDYCHHHGICTHHPGQLPVCRCLVGDDFWYMGQRCDVRMTRARLAGACLAVLFIMVAVIGISAFVAVRRYRAILIQAKVDQTRSSYRRFNHFDELSGRFWLRSWAGSGDSLDNPAFTRSDELLHLRALDRPCCYHDDTLSLASTCPSHGAHINTIYPHSSQYGWRGSEVSVGDGVLDSGKASDLSVCSWPVEPIHWTPFPLLQQLASHRTPTVRVSRPRSYCEGMELVDLGKSWTA